MSSKSGPPTLLIVMATGVLCWWLLSERYGETAAVGISVAMDFVILGAWSALSRRS